MSFVAGNASLDHADGTSQHDSADYYGRNWPFLPRRFEARLAPVSWFDFGGDTSLIDSGLDVRFGIPAAAGRIFAGNVAVGARFPVPAFFREGERTHSLWGRLEAYPLLFESFDKSGRALSQRGILALGLDAGVFHHEIALPEDPRADVGSGLGLNSDEISRRELRLEATVGYHVQLRNRVSLLFGLEPYWVVAADHDTDPDYHESWGFVLVLRVAASWHFHGKPLPNTAAR